MLRFFYFDASSWIGETQSSPRRHGDTEKIGDREKTENLPRMGADKRGSQEIAKIAGLPPQQAKTGLAGDPGIAKNRRN